MSRAAPPSSRHRSGSKSGVATWTLHGSQTRHSAKSAGVDAVAFDELRAHGVVALDDLLREEAVVRAEHRLAVRGDAFSRRDRGDRGGRGGVVAAAAGQIDDEDERRELRDDRDENLRLALGFRAVAGDERGHLALRRLSEGDVREADLRFFVVARVLRERGLDGGRRERDLRGVEVVEWMRGGGHRGGREGRAGAGGGADAVRERSRRFDEKRDFSREKSRASRDPEM